MNLNRSIQILLSSIVPGERGLSIALYECRKDGPRLQLCGFAGDPGSTEWAHQLVVSSALSGRVACSTEAEHFSLLHPEGERIVVLPVEAAEALAGILCVRPTGNARLTALVIERLRASARSLASILALTRKIRLYDDLVSEISALHFELADQKISDRARGLVEDGESADAIGAHVDRVSASLQFVDELKATIEDIRSQLNARQLLHEAKEKLRKDRGISEEEAYLTLRHMSRRSRTPLGTIAASILGQTSGNQLGTVSMTLLTGS